jgi:hypothetical protein
MTLYQQSQKHAASRPPLTSHISSSVSSVNPSLTIAPKTVNLENQGDTTFDGARWSRFIDTAGKQPGNTSSRKANYPASKIIHISSLTGN